MSNALLFLIAVLIGAVVGAVAVTIAKSIGRPKAEDVPEDAVDLQHAHTPTHAPAAPAGAAVAQQAS
jgi:PTS system fructose-specific IIC component